MDISKMNDIELNEVIQKAVMRFRELHPDDEIVVFSLPKAPCKEREAILNSMLDLQKR